LSIAQQADRHARHTTTPIIPALSKMSWICPRGIKKKLIVGEASKTIAGYYKERQEDEG